MDKLKPVSIEWALRTCFIRSIMKEEGCELDSLKLVSLSGIKDEDKAEAERLLDEIKFLDDLPKEKAKSVRSFIIGITEGLRSKRTDKESKGNINKFIEVLGKDNVTEKELNDSINFLKNINRKELGQVLVEIYTKEKEKGRDLTAPPLTDLADFYQEKIISTFVFKLEYFNLKVLRKANNIILENSTGRNIVGTLTNIFDDILFNICQEAEKKVRQAYRDKVSK